MQGLRAALVGFGVLDEKNVSHSFFSNLFIPEHEHIFKKTYVGKFLYHQDGAIVYFVIKIVSKEGKKILVSSEQ